MNKSQEMEQIFNKFNVRSKLVTRFPTMYQFVNNRISVLRPALEIKKTGHTNYLNILKDLLITQYKACDDFISTPSQDKLCIIFFILNYFISEFNTSGIAKSKPYMEISHILDPLYSMMKLDFTYIKNHLELSQDDYNSRKAALLVLINGLKNVTKQFAYYFQIDVYALSIYL